MNRQRVAELFDQVIELPIGERAAWIAAACAGDDALRAQPQLSRHGPAPGSSFRRNRPRNQRSVRGAASSRQYGKPDPRSGAGTARRGTLDAGDAATAVATAASALIAMRSAVPAGNLSSGCHCSCWPAQSSRSVAHARRSRYYARRSPRAARPTQTVIRASKSGLRWSTRSPNSETSTRHTH